jgi:hypothetical protein
MSITTELLEQGISKICVCRLKAKMVSDPDNTETLECEPREELTVCIHDGENWTHIEGIEQL